MLCLHHDFPRTPPELISWELGSLRQPQELFSATSSSNKPIMATRRRRFLDRACEVMRRLGVRRVNDTFSGAPNARIALVRRLASGTMVLIQMLEMRLLFGGLITMVMRVVFAICGRRVRRLGEEIDLIGDSAYSTRYHPPPSLFYPH